MCMNKTVDLQLCNVYDNCLACFHVGSGVGKPGCYVAAMMTWLWTDVRHTYNTNCNSTARTVEGLVLNRKIVGYATPSRHERRQHFGDYHSKKEGDGEAGGGWVSGGMWEPLASVKDCRWHHCTRTRMRIRLMLVPFSRNSSGLVILCRLSAFMWLDNSREK